VNGPQQDAQQQAANDDGSEAHEEKPQGNSRLTGNEVA
jgi:hypothetical protein